MAAILRNSVLGRTFIQFGSKIEAAHNVRCYASANRIKPFKKVEITDKARNDTKSMQMRAEYEALEEGASVTGQTVQSVGQSLASRGYLRPVKPYSPPENVESTIVAIGNTLKLSDRKQSFTTNELKFEFLAACYNAFKHSVPNSRLHEINTMDDTIDFYQTPVSTTLPLESLKPVELPENLHIQHEYIRFHPETDTMFGGKSAFPKSSTIVTGLKYKDKYRGHAAKKSWP
ncbi:39S ribosomal protein L50, mitochondrial [Toxorhynchites rutilus septentrionalis]|uniref:39S ribosomal protein L50, mitochondrial n=1 Tax=Toxorhynchites rutilus septentrionalis TaxID=329112 RepID=UPI00247ADF7E|nr:39S ribosomal protein L50, mitochondrial [Toxorhynchites rutilus septentrionalis]